MNEIIGYNNNLLSYAGNLLTPVYSDTSRIRLLFNNCTHLPTDYTDWYSYDANIGYTPWVHIQDNIWDYYPRFKTNRELALINGYEFNANGNPNISPSAQYGLLTKDRFGSNAEIYILSYRCKSSTTNEHNGVFYKCDAIYSASNISFIPNAGGLHPTTVLSSAFFQHCYNLEVVSNIDISNVTGMGYFMGCSITDPGHLVNTPSWDTSHLTNASGIFAYQNALTEIPLFDTSSMTNVSYMFSNCRNVTQGALALYTQMSTQANPPTNYTNCFLNCGIDTVTGAAELAQIPSSWGGTGA